MVDLVDGWMRKGVKMKRAHPKEDIILVAVIAALASTILYKIHSIKEPYRVIIDDGRSIESDGHGPYEVGSSEKVSVQFEYGRPIILEMAYGGLWSERSIRVNFEGAPWRKGDLLDDEPALKTMRCRAKFIVRLGSEYADMRVGEGLEPNEIVVYLADLDSDEYSLGIFRLGPPNSPTEPPGPLYGEGRAYLSRESGDVWVLEVDAWFRVRRLGVEDQEVHYVRLGFRVTVELRPLII